MRPDDLQLAWQRLRQNYPSVLAFFFLLALTLFALLAPLLTRFTYFEQNAAAILQAPGRAHWFGTDSLGRDLYVRIIFGARISLAIGFFTALFSLTIGVLYGAVAAYFGGFIDSAMMRLADIINALPMLLLAILLMLVFGRGPFGIFLALGITGWIGEARLVRGLVLQAKRMPYVESAHSLGLSAPRILFSHILPNILGPVIVSLSYGIPQNIMAESFLSFVGLGIEPPFASWGSLLNEGWRAYRAYPYLIFFPGVFLFMTVLAFNFLGDGLRDALDPQSLRRG